jgi:hypothetical protein
VDGADKLPGIANYFPASDQKTWHTNIPTYSKVKYAGVYPGVDLVYYGNQRQLEYDFVVAPNASPKPIELHFAGAKKLKLTPEGDLAVIAGNGEIAFHKPLVYQVQNGQRQLVEASFALQSHNRIRFALGQYDRSRELVIDPVLVYSTYLGGEGTDQAVAITVDPSGNAYIIGQTTSTSGKAYPADFPTTSKSYQPNPDTDYGYGGNQVFVTKLNATGTALVYSTYLGQGNNFAGAIAVDSKGDAYITGATAGTFPTTPRVFQGSNAGSYDAFVAELDPTGATLIESTYLGSGSYDGGRGIAVDPNGDVFVTGTTYPYAYGKFPTTPEAYQASDQSTNSVFVTRLSPDFSTLAYSTLIGGTGSTNANLPNGRGDTATGIAIDSEDNAYIVGYSGSPDYPTINSPFQKANNTAKDTTNPAPGYNAIVSKLNPEGSELLYSTYLGGSGSYDTAHKISYYDYGNAIRLDASGNIYVAGSTGSANFPTKGAYQASNPEVAKGGYQAGFVTKFNPTLSALVYSTYLGGTDGGADVINGLALDGADNAYVTGSTSSDAFPVTAGAYQDTNPGQDNLATTAFLTKLNSSGSNLVFSTYFGGANGDYANGIAVDASSNAYLCGYTDSTNFPFSSTAFQKTNNATSFTGWVAKLSTPPNGGNTVSTLTLTENPETQGAGSPVTFTATVASGSGTGAVPTGTVTFYVDGVKAAALSLTGGFASYTTSSLPVGSHDIVATYGGNSTYAPSTATGTEVIVTPLTPTPTFSLAPGTYTMAESVTIADAVSGATIYYTLNGSTPTEASTKYTGPITLAAFTTLNAIASSAGHTDSGVASATYDIVGSPSALAGAATGIATPKATLNAVVDTMGLAGSYYFRYGTTATTLTTNTATTALAATASPVNVSSTLTTLKTKTTYYFQVVVTTAGGTASGAVLNFTTN